MKHPLIPRLLASALFTFAGCKRDNPAVTTETSKIAAPKATLTPAHETSFAEVTSQLDAGGSVYGYLATDQWLANLSTNLLEMRTLLTDLPQMPEADRQKVNSGLDLLTRLVGKSGLEKLTGIGLSGIQITPELHRTKLIAHHKTGQGEGVMWNLLGKAPHALSGLDFLTKDTALASFGDLNLAALWQLVETELGNSDVPELSDGIKKFPAEFEKQTKMSWTKLLESYGGEAGFVLTLDEAHKMSLPFGKQSFEMPEPGLLIAIKMNNDLLYDRITSEMEKNEKTQVTEEKDLKMCAMPIPLPLALNVQITVASSAGYLFVASSPTIVRNALEVRNGKQPGLRKSADFHALMKYLPGEGNQFVYADRRFSETILALQKQAIQSDPTAAPMEPLQKFFLSKGPTFGLSVSAHTATGWQLVSVGNRDASASLVAAPALGGAAIVAAMALPAMAKAKARTQNGSCINNMKQIEIGFRMWADKHNEKMPFNVSVADGGTMELADRGGHGYDRNAFRHFQIMSNELHTTKILICPQDSAKHAAHDFENLTSENISYDVRSGATVDGNHPNELLLYCPIHKNYGYADGSVFEGHAR